MTKVLELPDELAAKVKDIPDLDERIVRFIKAEAVWYEQRQKRFSQETLDVVRQSRGETLIAKMLFAIGNTNETSEMKQARLLDMSKYHKTWVSTNTYSCSRLVSAQSLIQFAGWIGLGRQGWRAAQAGTTRTGRSAFVDE